MVYHRVFCLVGGYVGFNGNGEVVMKSIMQKAKVLSNDRKVDVGIRIRYAAIAKGIIKASTVDQKYIMSRYKPDHDVATA